MYFTIFKGNNEKILNYMEHIKILHLQQEMLLIHKLKSNPHNKTLTPTECEVLKSCKQPTLGIMTVTDTLRYQWAPSVTLAVVSSTGRVRVQQAAVWWNQEAEISESQILSPPSV